jgi:LPS O-antigen subunit length determinant protein (WzzB/FepE family)
VDTELKQYLIEMEERIVSSLKGYVNERSEQVETKLLTEFHKWASPAEARTRTISAALRAIDVEMEAIDDRVRKLEGRQSQ